jgi:hypothetical protein
MDQNAILCTGIFQLEIAAYFVGEPEQPAIDETVDEHLLSAP